MPVVIDELRSASGAALRTFAGIFFPRQGAARMKRKDLVAFIIDNLIKEEVASYVALTRRITGRGSLDYSQYEENVRERMRSRFGTALLDDYFACPSRQCDERLHPYLGHATDGSTNINTEEEHNRTTNTGTSVITDLQHHSTSTAVHAQAMPTSAEQDPPWPNPIDHVVVKERMRLFRDGTNIKVGPTCAVCARRSFSQDVLFVTKSVACRRVDARTLDLQHLRLTDQFILANHKHHFDFGHDLINGLALDRAGIHIDNWRVELDICQECHGCLTAAKPKKPPLSLANGNIRGYLPSNLQDVTWLEERLCARYLASACIIRLYDVTSPGAPLERPRIMKGHSCSFPLNVMSTAIKLPWSFTDGGPLISCVVIGPRAPRLQDLKDVFTVRREVVRSLLLFLRANFQDYPQFPIDEDSLQQLPEKGVPELLMRGLIYQQHGDVPSLFDFETSGMEQHPALGEDDDLLRGMTFLEHHGMLDINGVAVPAHERMSSALAHATGGYRPDLLIRYGSTFIDSYHNPALFPGMYPTLFPWGTGGFEAKREHALSFDRHASHLLDLADSSFRRHWSYVFMVANIKQRRLIHLGTKLACNARDFDRISTELRTIDATVIEQVRKHLSNGGRLWTGTEEERKVYTLLKQCDIISAKVPGSRAAMNKARSEIRGMIGEFGIFHLFLTLNPGPTHSPVFQVFYGDTTIDLNVRAPEMPDSSTRSIRVADDPVAAADYFHFHIKAVFKYLFGWDFRRRESSSEGGILGRLKAFYMVKEHTMRGQLHGHILIWLDGCVNPRELRQRMTDDLRYRDQYLRHFDDLIRHHAPGPPTSPFANRKPRQERPPDTADADFETHFKEDHHILAEAVQRHKCTQTCFKGGRDSCRFLFPHQLNEEASFDPTSKTITPSVRDATMNWHNPALLVATRHNHDLRCVQSGKGSAAAASYITSYATKSDETPVNQISMIQTIFNQMSDIGELSSPIKSLLMRCVMQYGRERQVHAQQAVTYVRDLGDTWHSHPALPMLSGRLYAYIIQNYGPARQSSTSTSTTSTSGIDRAQPGAVAAVGSSPSEPSSSQLESSTTALPVACEDVQDSDEEIDFVPLQEEGKVLQLVDYLHRGPDLDHVSYYDFVRFCELIDVPPRRWTKNHFRLSESHPKYPNKCHRYTPHQRRGVPRAISSSFHPPDGTPLHGDAYCANMLAHFKPFSVRKKLKSIKQTYEDEFANTDFSPSARMIMDNWNALRECDDMRDAEQLLRRKREARRDHLHNNLAIHDEHRTGPVDNPVADVDIEVLMHRKSTASSETITYMTALVSGEWFKTHSARSKAKDGTAQAPQVQHETPTFTKARKKQWSREMADLEAEIKARMAAPKACTGILAQSLGTFAEAPSTLGPEDGMHLAPNAEPRPVPPGAVRYQWSDVAAHEVIASLVEERCLSTSQALAFTIAARHFFMDIAGYEQEPLRLFMHGEAGTGKTVVVRLLRELLEAHGKGAEILFMAPTGKAAYAIGGTTQHAAFALEVQRRGQTSDELATGPKDRFSARRSRYLQKTFANVRWLFLDEVSMTSCDILAEIDQSLRVGRQNLNEPFGGVNVLFAGDLCQLPPVGSAALYAQQSLPSNSAEKRTMVELGRAIWQEINEVVNFTEQRRMRDQDMAAALSRLRLRRCTEEDVALFNQNVLRSSTHPDGVTLADRPDTVVLCRTNETVRALNHHKATAVAEASDSDLVVCAAEDRTGAPMTKEQRDSLLCYNGSGQLKVGLGRIPLYVGMPIVYRGPNQSVTLGITNGAFGVVVGWSVRPDSWGHMVPEGVVVRFSHDFPFSLTDLDDGCMPILPTKHSFRFGDTTPGSTVTDVKRSQLPIQPGFAMTVHSAQGITSHGPIVVDLRRGGFDAYVAASRTTSKANLVLLSSITLQELNSPPLPMALQAELLRLNAIAEATLARHKGNEWRLRPVGDGSSPASTEKTVSPHDPPLARHGRSDAHKRAWSHVDGAIYNDEFDCEVSPLPGNEPVPKRSRIDTQPVSNPYSIHQTPKD